MMKGYEEAKGEVAVAAASDLSWFAPAERKQFLGEAALIAFAALLLSAFLAGIKEAAQDKAKAAGKKVIEYLAEAITDLFSGKKKSAATKALDAQASAAPRVAERLSDQELEQILAEVERELTGALQTKLSAKRAAKLAGRVRESVARHILSKRSQTT